MDIDVSTAVTALAAATVAIGTVGAAKLIPNAAMKAWQWVTSAIRG